MVICTGMLFAQLFRLNDVVNSELDYLACCRSLYLGKANYMYNIHVILRIILSLYHVRFLPYLYFT